MNLASVPHKLFCYLLYFMINVCFIVKYGSRVTSYYLLFVFLYGFGVMLLSFLKMESSKKWYVVLLAVIGIIGMFVLQQSIDPMSINVDRWSAIHNFLDKLLQGEYPYAAKTHLDGYGSPFPVWQVFHLPFYFLGNVGLSIIFVFVLFLLSVWNMNNKACFRVLVFLFMSPAFWYEVAVRSDILTNFLFCCTIMNLLYLRQITLEKNTYFIAIICGLLLSTRISVAVPLAVMFFKSFCSLPWLKKFGFLLTALLVFALTFVPFLFYEQGEMLFFFQYNPFILQTRQGNLIMFILLIPIGIYFSMNWTNYVRCMEYSAYMLGLLVLLTYISTFINNKDWTFQGFYDITYLNMMLPFLVMALQEKLMPGKMYRHTGNNLVKIIKK